MSEALLQMVEEEHEPADLPRGPLLGDPGASTDTLGGSNSHSTDQGPSHGSDRRRPSLPSSLFRTRNLSTSSVRSNLFTHSWPRPAIYDIPGLCSYIEFAPPTPIIRLKWCKNQDGFNSLNSQDGYKHHFLLLEVKRPDNSGTIWLRLERRMDENASVLKSIARRPVPSDDTAEICSDISLLFDPSRSPVQLETEFTVPPLLQRLGDLLSILKEESPEYKLYSENCYFFCAVIYENLVSIGDAKTVTGVTQHFSPSRGEKAKARIRKRSGMWPPEPSSIASRNVHLVSSSQSVSTSTDTPSMLSPPLMDPIDGDGVRHRGSRPPLAFDTINFNAWVSHLFTHSWWIPTTYTISNLCAYIDRSPTAHITRSKWCKELTGLPHEFFLLKIEGPETKRFWLRIERRPLQSSTLARLMSSRSRSDDTAELSMNLQPLLKSKSGDIVETDFGDPPPLHNLSILLSILGEESPKYKLWPQNCFFFCSILYEHLFSIGRGVNISGGPSKLSMSLAPNVRATINRRVKDLLESASSSI